MKLKYIFTALVAFAAVFGCKKEAFQELSEIKVSKSYVSITKDGGSASITLKASDAWTIAVNDTTCKWLTISPANGIAGETKIEFKADKTLDGRNTTATITCAGRTQLINIIQGTSEIATATCAEVIAGPDSKSYKITGTCTAIANTQYGNFYIDDGTGVVYIYGTVDATGSYNWSKFDIEVGDIVTVQGPKTTYNGTVELVDATFISVTKSLLKIETKEYNIGKEGADLEIVVKYKGDGLDVVPSADWISISNINVGADSTIVNVKVAENVDDVRVGMINFASSKGKQSSTATVMINQKSGLAAYKLPFVQTFDTSFGTFEVNNIENPDGIDVFTIDTKYAVAKASAYVDKVNHPAVVALTSPKIDLNDATTASLTFEHAYRYGLNKYKEMTLEVSVDNGETWAPVLIPDYGPADKSFTMTAVSVSLTPYVGKLVMFRFLYTSAAEGCSTWEIKNVSVTSDEVAIKKIAQLHSIATTTEAPFTAQLDSAIVSYVSGGNAFLQDKSGGIQLYLKNHGLVAGDVIKGEISGKIKLYAGYPELTAIDCSKATKSTSEVAPETVSFATLKDSYLRYQNCMVKVDGEVTLDKTLNSSGRDGKFTQGEIEFAARLQDKNVTVEAGTGTLTCFPSQYNGALQLGIWTPDHFVK